MADRVEQRPLLAGAVEAHAASVPEGRYEGAVCIELREPDI
jgi:hypothetical protein